MIEEHFPYAVGAIVFALAANGMWVPAIFVGALALMASPLIYARDPHESDYEAEEDLRRHDRLHRDIRRHHED